MILFFIVFAPLLADGVGTVVTHSTLHRSGSGVLTPPASSVMHPCRHPPFLTRMHESVTPPRKLTFNTSLGNDLSVAFEKIVRSSLPPVSWSDKVNLL